MKMCSYDMGGGGGSGTFTVTEMVNGWENRAEEEGKQMCAV